jgi:hypothetical protein
VNFTTKFSHGIVKPEVKGNSAKKKIKLIIGIKNLKNGTLNSVVMLKKIIERFTTLQTLHGYLPFIEVTIRSFPHSWQITGFITKVTRRA